MNAITPDSRRRADRQRRHRGRERDRDRLVAVAPITSTVDRAGVATLIAANKACGYEFHPAANLFPPMTDQEFDDLVADIKAHGLNEPITIDEGMILDGRHRALACDKIGIKPWRQESPSKDPFVYILSVNLHRRHLSAEQKRELIANLLKAKPEKSDRQVAEMAKASPTTVGKVRAEMESTVQAGQLPKRVGKDGKARKQPAKRRRTPDDFAKDIAAKRAVEPRLNAIGKPYSQAFDPNYKLKTPPPSIARLFAPQRGFHWVGETRPATASTERVTPSLTDMFTDGIANITGTSSEIDPDERADAVLGEIDAQQAEPITPPAKVAVGAGRKARKKPATAKKATAAAAKTATSTAAAIAKNNATDDYREVIAETVSSTAGAASAPIEREILAVDIERLASRLVRDDAEGARILHEIIVWDDRHALAALAAALARGLGIEE
jgi:ParB/Sulfiredoxin domain